MTESELTQLLCEAFPGAQVSWRLRVGTWTLPWSAPSLRALGRLRASSAFMRRCRGSLPMAPCTQSISVRKPLNEVACGQSDYRGGNRLEGVLTASGAKMLLCRYSQRPC